MVHVQDRPIYRVEVILPDDLKVRQVSAPGEYQWARTRARRASAGDDLFRHRPVRATCRCWCEARWAAGRRSSRCRCPSIEVCGVDAQAGDIAVQVDPAFDVEARPLQDCQETELEQLAGWLNPQQRQLTRLALHYRRPGYRGTLRLAPRKADVDLRHDQPRPRHRPGGRGDDRADVHGAARGVRELRFQFPPRWPTPAISVPMLRRKTVAPIERQARRAAGASASSCKRNGWARFACGCENDRLLGRRTPTACRSRWWRRAARTGNTWPCRRPAATK